MKVESKGYSLEIEPNSRPLLAKRMISTGFDTVSLLMVFLLLTYLIMQTPLAATYNQHAENCRVIEREAITVAGNDMAAVSEILKANDSYREELFAANLHSYLLKMLAGFIGEGILFLLIPLVRKDRATIGRALTGIVLFSRSRQTAATWHQVLSRFIFIFVMESITPYLWTGIYTFILIPVLRLIVVMLNRNRKTLCDYITFTDLIEKISYSSIH